MKDSYPTLDRWSLRIERIIALLSGAFVFTVFTIPIISRNVMASKMKSNMVLEFWMFLNGLHHLIPFLGKGYHVFLKKNEKMKIMRI